MKKIVLGLAAMSLMGGVAVYALACDQDKSTDKNTSATSASVSADSKDGCASKSASLTASGSCSHGSNAKASLAGSGGSCAKGATAGMSCGSKNSSATAAKHGEGCSDFAFTVNDIHGECCVGKVEKALTMKGVQAVYVDVDNHRAYVCSSKSKIDSKAAIKSLRKAGYVEAVYMGADAEHCAHALSSAGDKSCHPGGEKAKMEVKKSSKV
jgi:copper chaperone CopZ